VTSALSSVLSTEVKSLKKKFKSKAFAKNCNRTFIREIENPSAHSVKLFLREPQEVRDQLGGFPADFGLR